MFNTKTVFFLNVYHLYARDDLFASFLVPVSTSGERLTRPNTSTPHPVLTRPHVNSEGRCMLYMGAGERLNTGVNLNREACAMWGLVRAFDVVC